MEIGSGMNSMNTIGKIRVMLTAIAVIPLVLYLIVNNLMITSSLLNVEQKIYDEKLFNIKDYFEVVDANLDNITSSYAERYDILDYIKTAGSDKRWFRDKIQTPATKFHGVQLILFIGSNGDIIESIGLRSDYTKNDLLNSSFAPLIKGTLDFRSNNWYRLAAYNNELYRVSARPIYDDSTGLLKGILVLGKKVTSMYINAIEEETGWKLFVDTNDNIVAGDETLDTSKYQKLFLENKTNRISHMDKKYMIGQISLEDTQGNIVSNLYAVIPRNIFPDTNILFYRNGLLVLGLSVVFFMLLGSKFKKNITIPISCLEKQITQMAGNNVLDYVNVAGPDEIVKLTNSFNRMAQNVNIRLMENESLKTEIKNDKINNEFLANISHELRTPLNVILGLLQLSDLNSKKNVTADKKEVDRYNKVIRQNCFRLLRMVNNLIDITKISSHAFHIHLKNNNIIEIIDSLVFAVNEYIERKGISILLKKDIDEKILACDAEQIERMFLNLLSNAIKFMPDGGNIIVSIKDKTNKVTISIKDNGSGIPPDQLNSIFDNFKQVDKSFTRKHEGSGIGLSLVKSIVDLHQGEITVKSKLKEGSEFIVELPVILLPEKNNNLKIINIDNNYEEKIQIEFSDINI